MKKGGLAGTTFRSMAYLRRRRRITCTFLERLLRDTLDFPGDTERRIEQANQKTRRQNSDQLLQMIRRAWQKKVVHFKNTRSLVDHDYPSVVLKKRLEYAEVKKILRERKIKFQAPYPVKLQVHYDEGIQTYQKAVEATKDTVIS